MRRFVLVLAVAALIHVPAAAAWSWPVEGPVLRPFVFGNDPYAAGQHRGIDIGASDGTPVRAATAGTVSFAGTVPNGGRTVTVQTTGGLSVTYLELGAVRVGRGAEVAEGDLIGTIGSAGHVHFGVRVSADPQGYLDPLLFLPARVTPATEAEPDSVAEPSPEAEPVPAADPPRTAEQPAPDPVASEPGASPVADSPAEAAPSAPVDEPAASETSVADSEPVAEPSPVLEPVPVPEPVAVPDPSPTLAPVPLEPAASEPAVGVEPAAEPEVSPASESPATVGPAVVVEEAPAEQGVAEPEPVAEPSPVLEPTPVAERASALASAPVEPRAFEPEPEPVADSPATVVLAPVVDVAPAEQGVAELEPVVQPAPVIALAPVVDAPDSTPRGTVTTPPVEAAPAEEPAVEPDGPVVSAGPEWPAAAVAANLASVPAIAPIPVGLVAVVEGASGTFDPASSSASTPTPAPVASDLPLASPTAEVPPQPMPAETAAFVEPTLAALTATGLTRARRPVPPVSDRRAASTVLESATSRSTRDVSQPRSSTVVRVRPAYVVTALPEKPLKRVPAGQQHEEPKPGPVAATRATRPKADAEIVDLAPLALLAAGLLLLAGTTAVRRRRRPAVVAEVPSSVEPARCPLGRTPAPRSIHGCARVRDHGSFLPAVRPLRPTPARPLPRPRRQAQASIRA